MTLTNKLSALALGSVFALTAMTAPAASAGELEDQIAALLAQISALQSQVSGGTTSTGTTAGTGYTHINTLRYGSRGNQVAELQTCLNALGNDTGVVDGIFGTNTKSGVMSFQAEKAIVVDGIVGQVTGPMYEAACATTTGGTTTGGTTTGTVTGDKLVVSGMASDDLFVGPSQKVVFTKLTLEAGDEDVMVKDIIVEVTGAADSNVIEKVMILDSAMVEIENDSVDSDDEAKIDVDMEVRDGETITLYVAALIDDNVTGTKITASDGLEVSLKVISIVTDGADVEGTPVMGASHTVKDNVTVDNFDASISKDESSPKIGEEEVKLATVNVDNSTNDDQMLKSLKLFRTGTAGDDALENVTIEADGKTYEATQDDDEYTFDFGDGIEIADGDDLDLEVMADIIEDDGDNLGFDIMDITVIDTDMIILVDTTGTFTAGAGTADWTYASTATIGTSSVIVGKTSEVSDEKIAASTDEAELASFDVDVDGEWIDADVDVVITLDTSSVVGVVDFTDLDLDNIALYVDGDKVSDTEDASWAADGAMTVTFDEVRFEDDGTPVDYIIKADIGRDAPSKATYTVTSVQLTAVETKSGENVGPFPAAAKTINVVQEVEGSAVEGDIVAPSPATVTNDNSVADNGSEQIVAEIEIDANDSGDDINLTEVKFDIVVGGTATVADVTNCTLDESSDSEDAGTSMTFGLDLDITKDTKETLLVRCDISSSAVATDTITVQNLTFDAEGVTTTSNFNNEAGQGGSSLVTVTASTLTAKLDADTPDAKVVMENESAVEIGRIEVEADDGDVKIATITAALSQIEPIDNGKVKIYVDGTYEGDVVLVANGAPVVSDTLNVTVVDGEKVEIVFKADMVTDATVAPVVGNETTALTVSVVTLSDSTTASDPGVAVTLTPVVANAVTITDAIPVVTQLGDDVLTTTTSLEADKDVLEFSIEADGGDVTLSDATFTLTTGGVMTLDNAEVIVYSDAAHTNEVSTTTVGTLGTGAVTFTDKEIVNGGVPTPVVISEGETYYFVLNGDVSASAGGSMIIEVKDVATGITFTTPALAADLVLEDDIKATVNTTL